MLPLKLVRSVVLGEAINNNPLLISQNRHHSDDDNSRTPFLLFLPGKELITDTYRLATIAREMGMNLHPTPSLSHIILSYPPPSSSSSSLSSPSSTSWSSSSLSSASLPDHSVPLPFPSLSAASVAHLRAFVRLSNGLFKLVYAPFGDPVSSSTGESHWNCCSFSLFSRLSGVRIQTMEGFSRALAGMGWTLFKTKENPTRDFCQGPVCGGKSVFLFRKVDTNRVRAGECRIRELRLPTLDFRNAPLRILQYILLMTDDIFYLA